MLVPNALPNMCRHAWLIHNRVNYLAPGSRVLYPRDTPYGALLHGIPLYRNWYQPFRAKIFEAATDSSALKSVLLQEHVDFVIMDFSPTASDLDSSLRGFLSDFGHVEATSRQFTLYSVRDTPLNYANVFSFPAQTAHQTGDDDRVPPAALQRTTASTRGRVLAVFPTNRTKQARYQATFSCPSPQGYFIAQINWNRGDPYYRLVPCQSGPVAYVESISIPIGASSGTLYISSRDIPSIEIRSISVDVY